MKKIGNWKCANYNVMNGILEIIKVDNDNSRAEASQKDFCYTNVNCLGNQSLW